MKAKGLIERMANPASGADTLTKFKISEKVRVEPYHKERVQVLQRIDIDTIHKSIVAGKQVDVDDLPKNDRFAEFEKAISEIVPSFTPEHLSSQYAVQDHSGNSATFFREEND